MKHSRGHIFEIAWSFTTEWIRAVDMFYYRLIKDLPEDKKFFEHKGFRQDVDLHCYLVSLNRLRKAVNLARQVSSSKKLKRAIEKFDKNVPSLSLFRNVGEHFDDYIQQQGHNKKVKSSGLRVYTMEQGKIDYKINWLGNTLSLRGTSKAAYALYKSFIEWYKSEAIVTKRS